MCFIVTRFGTSQVGFSPRTVLAVLCYVRVENVSENSLAEMDRRQSNATSRRSISSITYECVCVRVVVCLCVCMCLSGTHEKRIFSPSEKKKTYRRKIHWHVEVDRLSLSPCVCLCVCVRACVRVYFCGFSWSSFSSGACCAPATNIGKFL